MEAVEFENGVSSDGCMHRGRANSSLTVSSDGDDSLDSVQIIGATTSEVIQEQHQCLQNEFAKMHAEKQ